VFQAETTSVLKLGAQKACSKPVVLYWYASGFWRVKAKILLSMSPPEGGLAVQWEFSMIGQLSLHSLFFKAPVLGLSNRSACLKR